MICRLYHPHPKNTNASEAKNDLPVNTRQAGFYPSLASRVIKPPAFASKTNKEQQSETIERWLTHAFDGWRDEYLLNFRGNRL